MNKKMIDGQSCLDSTVEVLRNNMSVFSPLSVYNIHSSCQKKEVALAGPAPELRIGKRESAKQ